MPIHLLAALLLVWMAPLNGAPKATIISTHTITPPNVVAFTEADLFLDGSRNICAIFSGVREGAKDNLIFFTKTSTGKKRSASQPVILSEENGFNRGPSVAIGGGAFHCAWLSYSEESKIVDVAHRRSLDSGQEWGPIQKFPVGEMRVRYPTVVTGDDGLVFIVGSNQKGGEPAALYLFRSGDNGRTWSSVDVNFPERKGEGATDPRLVVNATGACLIWLDSTRGGRAIVFSRSDDRGRTWSAPMPINDDLKNPVSAPALCAFGDRIYASWTLAASYETSIFFDVSGDGGRRWGQDQLVYREGVTQVTPKLQCMDDRLLLAWSSYRSQAVRRGAALAYKWAAEPVQWNPPDEGAYLSLYGDEKRLSHFKEFELISITSKRTIAVFTEVVDEKAAVFASLTSNPAKGFTSAFSITQREPGFEFRLQGATQLDRTTFAVLYNKLRIKRFDIDPVPAAGELLMSLVKISG